MSAWVEVSLIGLLEYDHNGAKAKALEWAIGIKVIRHSKSSAAETEQDSCLMPS